jgi:hypothetical protein
LPEFAQVLNSISGFYEDKDITNFMNSVPDPGTMLLNIPFICRAKIKLAHEEDQLLCGDRQNQLKDDILPHDNAPTGIPS